MNVDKSGNKIEGEVIIIINRDLIKKEIEKSGLKKSYIAKCMGLTTQGLNKKLRDGRFTTDQAGQFCDVIGIVSTKTKCEIFFAQDVDKSGNK